MAQCDVCGNDYDKKRLVHLTHIPQSCLRFRSPISVALQRRSPVRKRDSVIRTG
jgi:hypothetical protein